MEKVIIMHPELGLLKQTAYVICTDEEYPIAIEIEDNDKIASTVFNLSETYKINHIILEGHTSYIEHIKNEIEKLSATAYGQNNLNIELT